jgi:hypothetical protein
MYFLCIDGIVSFKSGLKFVPIFLLNSQFYSERASGVMFNRRPPVKMVDFYSEVTFISAFGGIRDIFKAHIIMQLCF